MVIKRDMVLAAMAVLLLLFVAMVGLATIDWFDGQNGLRAVECSKRMAHIGKVLRDYARDTSDFPRDDAGRFSPDKLVCDHGKNDPKCVIAGECACTLYGNTANKWKGFLWCLEPTKEQIEEFVKGNEIGSEWQPTGREWVVMCHDEESIHK